MTRYEQAKEIYAKYGVDVEKAIEKYGIRPEKTCIALGGGFSLNCPANTYIMNKYNFKKQYNQITIFFIKLIMNITLRK